MREASDLPQNYILPELFFNHVDGNVDVVVVRLCSVESFGMLVVCIAFPIFLNSPLPGRLVDGFIIIPFAIVPSQETDLELFTVLLKPLRDLPSFGPLVIGGELSSFPGKQSALLPACWDFVLLPSQ